MFGVPDMFCTTQFVPANKDCYIFVQVHDWPLIWRFEDTYQKDFHPLLSIVSIDKKHILINPKYHSNPNTILNTNPKPDTNLKSNPNPDHNV